MGTNGSPVPPSTPTKDTSSRPYSLSLKGRGGCADPATVWPPLPAPPVVRARSEERSQESLGYMPDGQEPGWSSFKE